MWMDREQGRTAVRQHVGRHAAEHFQRHAAYMARRGWIVVGPPRPEPRGIVVTYGRRPPEPEPALYTGVGDKRSARQTDRPMDGAGVLVVWRDECAQ